MEAVPRLPMLSFELRTSVDEVDFSTKLKQYIRNYYNEDPTLYASGITGIDSLRREAVYPSKSIVGTSLLKRYFCQLHFMASRFPMKENEEAAVSFSWKALHSNAVITLNDISLEMASILYNVGALHTQLGAMDNRATAEGMKMSCTHFQCAAWAFQHIVEEYSFAKSLGFSKVLMSFLCHMCLAQAQECILEKSMMDNRKSAITAKVAIQVVDYYKQSHKLLGDWPKDEGNPSDITSLKVFKKWEKYILFKMSYYESISFLFQGQQAEDQQKMGERVTFYQAAYDSLEEARKWSSGVEGTDMVTEALNFVHDVIEVKRKAAKNENEFIYHEHVPLITHLVRIKGASLVKGIPFSVNDPEVCGPDLFSNIVPMKAHESSSLYSEEKAKLLRRVNGMIENKDEELETFLSMLDLDEIKSKMDGSKLPQELIDRCASLSAKPDAIQNLTEAMNKLSDIYHDVEVMLTDIWEMLKEEENREKEYQEMVGKRPPSIAATDLTREAKKYQEAHAKASESNQTLHKAMVMHVSNLKLLSLPLKELINHIPTVVDSSEVEAVTNEMRHLISKVEEMKQQRLMLTGQLRDMACQDDITQQVITYSGDKIEELFEQELKKYDKCVSLIEQNLAAQENILKALKDAYARYGSTKKSTGELHKKRAAMISSLIASYDAYEDLLAKSSKGLDFYKKLETNVSKLMQRVKGTCKVQDEEREQMMKSVRKSEFSQQEVTPSNPTPKLKDYLNLKKETGKLPLEHSDSVAPVGSYFPDPVLAQQNWIPGIRPAPVGSEETETSFKGPNDSFPGFYQGQGKDQVWSNTLYSGPQSADSKLKFHLPQTPLAHQAYSQIPTYQQGRDAYPISCYSTVAPKTDGQGYEPKSNYYDIQSSPNRCYNMPTYPEATPSSSATNVAPLSAAPEVGYTSAASSNVYGQNSEIPSYYAYSVPGSYISPLNSASQPSITGYSVGSSVQPDTSIGAYGSTPHTQVSSGYNSGSLTQIHPSYGSESTYSSGISGYTTTQVQPTGYTSLTSQTVGGYGSAEATSTYPNSYQPLSATAYGSAVTGTTSLSNPVYPNYRQTPTSQDSTSFPNQDVAYQNLQTYQSSSNTAATSNNQTGGYLAGQSGYPFTQTSETQFPQQVPSMDVAQASWNPSYNPTGQQYFQSGNESLYTASQTVESYAMTSSNMYKTPEAQAYSSNEASTQYYTSQYGGGGYGGQAEYNTPGGNPVTYMQAGTDRQQAVTTTTFSNSESKSSPVTNPSYVDLLAGLDFNISHSPLIPETTSTKKEDTGSDAAAKPKTPPKAVESAPKASVPVEATQEKLAPKFVSMENVTQFAQEVEKYEKFVEGLTLKTLNGPTSLDLKWKEIVDLQEKISPLHIISVARCYPMKNRFPDILPYDESRVELPSTKDDYINASRMMDLTKLTPSFILTQAPLPSTYSDFWAMVFEQQVEVIICLLSDTELDGHLYWPLEKGQELEMGKLKISLQSSNVRSHWVERILSICVMETRATRVVVHLQFTAWPGSSFPESPGPFLSFSSECINFFTQQRSYCHPVVVHCISGVGRTGLFCLIIASILDIQAGRGIPDLAALAGRMCQFRKSCLRDREHLKFAYQAVLYYSQDFLMKRGILTTRSTFEDKKSKEGKCHTRHPSEDFLVVPASDVSQIQSGVERLEIDSGKKQETETKNSSGGGGRSQSVCSTLSRTSSGRSSPSSLPPDLLSSLESGNFSLKADANLKKKRFTPESFGSKGSSIDASAAGSSSDDPLNKLDPLWTMKK